MPLLTSMYIFVAQLLGIFENQNISQDNKEFKPVGIKYKRIEEALRSLGKLAKDATGDI